MSPGPWSFHQHHYGLQNVVIDADHRVLASHIRFDNGPMIAASPALLHALTLIAAIDGPAQAIAQTAIEDFSEREGMMLADWDPHRPRPRLRIVGEAS